MGANTKSFGMRPKRNKRRERKRVTLFAFAWTFAPFSLVKPPSALAKSHQKSSILSFWGGEGQRRKKKKNSSPGVNLVKLLRV